MNVEERVYFSVSLSKLKDINDLLYLTCLSIKPHVVKNSELEVIERVLHGLWSKQYDILEKMNKKVKLDQ